MPEDAVDAIVRDWQRQRPELDFAGLHVFSRIKRLARRLDQVRQAAFAQVGLELWEFDVLSALRRAGAPHELAPKALLEQNMVSSGTMTNRIDRLVERGLVTRSQSEHDRRSMTVRMTPEGMRAVDEAIELLLKREDALLVAIDPAERAELTDALRALTLRFEDFASDKEAEAAPGHDA